MSLIITVYTVEGIVMASDSRITLSSTTKNGTDITVTVGSHLTDTTFKTFLTQSNVGISYCGNSSIQGKPIAGYVEAFIQQNNAEDVNSIKDKILPYFIGIEPTLNTTFIVAGYADDGTGNIKQYIYLVKTVPQTINATDTTNQGARWAGETDVLSRLLTTMYSKQADGSYLPVADYNIPFNFFTLQDAIDFAKYAVQVTIDTMRFEERVKSVGGPIDILVIKPEGAFWIDRKELHK